MFLSSLLGQDSKDQSKPVDCIVRLASLFGRTVATDISIGVGGSTLTPLVSSHQFVLLPIQSDCQLNEIALQVSRNANRKCFTASDKTKSNDYVWCGNQ